jgi:hypothetical protein
MKPKEEADKPKARRTKFEYLLYLTLGNSN